MPPQLENRLNASLKPIDERNVEEAKRLNLFLFPGVYCSPAFYRDVAESGFYSRVAYLGDRPVGLVCCCVEPEQAVETSGGKSCHRLVVMTIGVLAQYRCFGIGSLMMRHVIAVARHDDRLHKIQLHVKVDNEMAIDFYRRFGFAIKELKKKYYVRMEPPDAYVMELTLK